MIFWKIGLTLDFGIISLIPRLCALYKNPTLVDIKIGKSNTPTIFKMMLECSSLYKILECK